MTFKDRAKLVVNSILKPIPTNWLTFAIESNLNANLVTIARLALSDRNITIAKGIAAGIKFNSAKTNPDAVLGTYELPLQQLLSNRLKPGDIFYDIGANVGFFTAVAAKLVTSTGKVYSFEPVPENAAIVRHNVRQNNFSNVTIIEKAVSATTGEGKLWLARYAGGHTLSDADLPPDLKGSLAVELVSIDRLIEQKEIDPPTVVKVDVEGAEFDVLQGMSQTISQFKPTIIYEVDDASKESLLEKRQKIDDFLEKLGYTIALLDSSYSQTTWNVEHLIATPN
jgi:FkbM family methyltransferase